jgi:hypothetical protein
MVGSGLLTQEQFKMYTGSGANEGHPQRDALQSVPSDYEDHGEISFRKLQPREDDEKQMRELAFNNAFLGSSGVTCHGKTVAVKARPMEHKGTIRYTGDLQ